MMFYQDKCKGCGKCKEVCPYHFEKCDLCERCTIFCPVEARKICGKAYTVEEVFAEVVKDKCFYDNSGDGVTFSGGECMLQPEFLLEILQKCKENCIHTAVDTAGHVPFARFEKILPCTDLFLYDIKAFDPELHKKYVGVDNELILENLKKLLQCGAKVWIRIPVIPGVNDTEEEMQKIKEFLADCGGVVELLPYHAMGEHKYEALSKEVQNFKAPDAEKMRQLKEILA